MKQLFGNLLLNFLARFLFVHESLWLSLKIGHCQDVPTSDHVPHCYNTRSGKICVTKLLNQSLPVRKPFKEASHLCKSLVPSSSLITINSLEIQNAFEGFLTRQTLMNYEEIITDARMLSESENQTWSWVNGQPYSPGVSTDVRKTDAACVHSKREQSLEYCFGDAFSQLSWICEFPGISYHNKSYIANEGNVAWFDARNKCLREGGDLASLMDLQTIEELPWLRENQKYWIGLHRNKWIWNSTGAALTYTNWKNGYPEESNDKQCTCFSPKCSFESGRSICEAGNDRKWRTCNCNNSYAIVCQSDSVFPNDSTTEIVHTLTPRSMATPISTSINTSPTGIINSPATSHLEPGIPVTIPVTDATTISYHTIEDLDRTTASTPFMTQESSKNSQEYNTTNIASPSKGLLDTTGILLVLLLLVAVVIIIIVAVILFIRKRKYGRGHDGSYMKKTHQDEMATSEYATVVPGNVLSEATASASYPIYAEVAMIQQPIPSSNTIYASIQPTSEVIDMGESIVYADLDIPQKDLQNH